MTQYTSRSKHDIHYILFIHAYLRHFHSEFQAELRLKQLRRDIEAAEDKNLDKTLKFVDGHGERAFADLRERGMGKYRRGSNSESRMRLLRQLEGIPFARLPFAASQTATC